MDNKKRKRRTLAERLYKGNVLPDGNLFGVRPGDVVNQKIENPPFDDAEDETKPL